MNTRGSNGENGICMCILLHHYVLNMEEITTKYGNNLFKE